MYGNWDKLQPDGPLGSHVDFTIFFFLVWGGGGGGGGWREVL